MLNVVSYSLGHVIYENSFHLFEDSHKYHSQDRRIKWYFLSYCVHPFSCYITAVGEHNGILGFRFGYVY